MKFVKVMASENIFMVIMALNGEAWRFFKMIYYNE